MPTPIEITSPVRATTARHGCPLRVVDIDALPASALLTTAPVAALTGFAAITLKVWRSAGDGRGPRVPRVEGRPRYLVSDVRAWMGVGS